MTLTAAAAPADDPNTVARRLTHRPIQIRPAPIPKVTDKPVISPYLTLFRIYRDERAEKMGEISHFSEGRHL